ncbi:hypothetical protein HPP92_020854 [Vanilla planifolia]|uniref:SOSEKI DIX-like domain-containing protein n=1 Tax=Vanilla planifolia TaxID=51239 RepID=A0A835UGJ8_VANPL|nr:hypothetical protein HPP92_021164 [Vanilla planifolia]KAG0462378.1 hypothetical protein HPP92_020854 [Vanilla planifolia]
MAAATRGRWELSRHCKEREVSPERTKVWVEPKPKKASVVYYLSRNGLLEHPHFMEVTLSSRDGLYLRDVLNRLNFLRGKGMATMYSWSSKRSYKNGFVWHDLSEADFIHPTHGQEYVLKGSELLHCFSTSSSGSNKAPDIMKSESDETYSLPARRKKMPWNSLDLGEYKMYKSGFAEGDTSGNAADASTQTEEQWRRRVFGKLDVDDGNSGDHVKHKDDSPMTELVIDEISPPASSSSTETLESLLKADGRIITTTKEDGAVQGDDYSRAATGCPSARFRASAVLKHLISCGSISTKDQGEFSLRPPEHSGSLPPGCLTESKEKKETEGEMEVSRTSVIRLEEKEYFSGSLIEIRRKNTVGDGATPFFTRSFSYNADRGPKTEIEGVPANCIPLKAEGDGAD